MKGEEKVCVSCGRVMEWRKKWEDCWEEVRYCSAGCRKRKVKTKDEGLEVKIMELLGKRSQGATICPSEAARELFGEDDWRPEMERTRRAARRLVDDGKIVMTQKGAVVDPSTAKGPIRLRRK